MNSEFNFKTPPESETVRSRARAETSGETGRDNQADLVPDSETGNQFPNYVIGATGGEDLEALEAPEETYATKRAANIDTLQAVIMHFQKEQIDQDNQVGSFAAMPDNFIKDDFANLVIQFRSMHESNRLCDEAKKLFGRELTVSEDELLHTALDYILKRIISEQVRKEVSENPLLEPRHYLGTIYAGFDGLLPGDSETFLKHDLVHLVLALKQGLENENSPIPTFMHSKTGFNSSEQAMLEEAFASLFTDLSEESDSIPSYDSGIRNPLILRSQATYLFNEKTTSLFRNLSKGKNPIFLDPVLAEEAVGSIRLFINNNFAKLDNSNLLVSLALFSQAASLSAAMTSTELFSLSAAERLNFIKESIKMAQSNIDALITGAAPADADEKYKKTLAITLETCTKSLQTSSSNPEAPIFVEILLEALRPLESKAKAQAQATFDRFSSVVPGNPQGA